MTQTIAERAKVFGGAKPRNKKDNLDSNLAYRNIGVSASKESRARYNLTAALNSSAKSFETPSRQGTSDTTTFQQINSPKGVNELGDEFWGGNKEEKPQNIVETGFEQEIEDAFKGIEQLRHQVEQMRRELEEVRQKRKDHIKRSKQEYKALITSLKQVELLREENSRMVDEIGRMELAGHN
mmetsp:Transcript_11550/g.16586  ORF Transcript_11550/g.16586 Transcript_11550/m.16586 type:complete len:182 (+) Transcript_11550:185-730(+)|eukprot:CAMPEP_0172424434 /NCGR_PEP_ID=MMETSP1064-20121228/25118_1 /TAXON_ID=202472 /ORGANISM="Aulacoseira subarctica , Strain CCAP 1002/5" /LENGTH=181 /DNA_ID=CAMNT_0013166501 /DNA_START=138 /DNA_END=683 /DNA_ORIENTATION=+